ncbi:MAG: hypothetical protein J5802_08955 [Butyrivibrio sp.]|nr:hypothetical protein [Butyrivibrio sp.]
MSKGKGFGKFILFCATVGAAAAGVYYYLNKRDAEIADSFDDDDFEEFEDFDEDFDDTNETRFGSRKYVDIKPVEEKTAATAEDTAFEDDEEGLEDTAFDEEAEKTSEAKEADKAEAKDSEIATPDASEEFFDDEKEEK